MNTRHVTIFLLVGCAMMAVGCAAPTSKRSQPAPLPEAPPPAVSAARQADAAAHIPPSGDWVQVAEGEQEAYFLHIPSISYNSGVANMWIIVNHKAHKPDLFGGTPIF